MGGVGRSRGRLLRGGGSGASGERSVESWRTSEGGMYGR